MRYFGGTSCGNPLTSHVIEIQKPLVEPVVAIVAVEQPFKNLRSRAGALSPLMKLRERQSAKLLHAVSLLVMIVLHAQLVFSCGPGAVVEQDSFPLRP